jgi:hypothetical protein
MRIEDADVVVGIFWRRLGTPTGNAASGTEHELRRAWAAWEQRRRPQVKIYFCQRPFMPDNSAQADQLLSLLVFPREDAHVGAG